MKDQFASGPPLSGPENSKIILVLKVVIEFRNVFLSIFLVGIILMVKVVILRVGFVVVCHTLNKVSSLCLLAAVKKLNLNLDPNPKFTIKTKC